MRPVRIELGVHFGLAFVVGVANFATVELKCLTLAEGDRPHSRNIGRDGGRSEGGGVPIAPQHTSTEDGHVRLRVDLQRDDTGYKCCSAHLAR